METDPISIPHPFDQKENIEISGFLTATIALGQRTTIVRNARRFMSILDNDPFDFGLWPDILPFSLYIPLDVYTGNVARALGLLQRKQNDWKAVVEYILAP